MPPAGFEPTIPASERPQMHAIDRAATGTGTDEKYRNKIQCVSFALVKRSSLRYTWKLVDKLYSN
jgi:hypothetical protein